MKQSLKNTIGNVYSGLTNAIISVVCVSVVTRKLGVESAGIYTIAFATGSLFLLMGNWGMRNYQVSDVQHKYNWKEYLTSRIITFVLMILCGTIYTIITEDFPSEKSFAIIGLILIKSIDALEDVFFGKYQQDGRLDIAGFCMGTRLLLQIIFFSVLILFGKDLVFTIYATFIFGFLVLLTFLKITRSKFNFLSVPLKKDSLKSLLITCLPICASSFLSFYLVNMSKYVINERLDNTAQAYYGYIAMALFITYLFANFVYAPLLNDISKSYSEGNYKKFKKLNFIVLGLITLIGCGIIFFGNLLGIPFLEILYGVSLEEYHSSFLILLIGSVVYAYINYLIVVITIMRRQKILFIGSVICTIASRFITVYLVDTYQIAGAATAYLISMILLFLVYVFSIILVKPEQNL